MSDSRPLGPRAGLGDTLAAPPNVSLRLLLPRDAASIPVVRHLAQHALGELGARRDCIHDVGLAITEACANVVQHAGSGDSYAVQVSIEADICEIRVIDTGGASFDRDGAAASVRERSRDDMSESGRGIAIIDALMDDLSFEIQPETGTLVRMVKRLEFAEDSPARRLMLLG